MAVLVSFRKIREPFPVPLGIAERRNDDGRLVDDPQPVLTARREFLNYERSQSYQQNNQTHTIDSPDRGRAAHKFLTFPAQPDPQPSKGAASEANEVSVPARTFCGPHPLKSLPDQIVPTSSWQFSGFAQ